MTLYIKSVVFNDQRARNFVGRFTARVNVRKQVSGAAWPAASKQRLDEYLVNITEVT